MIRINFKNGNTSLYSDGVTCHTEGSFLHVVNGDITQMYHSDTIESIEVINKPARKDNSTAILLVLSILLYILLNTLIIL